MLSGSCNCLDCCNFKMAILRYQSPVSYSLYKRLSMREKITLCKGGEFRIIFCSEKDLLLVMPPLCRQLS